MYILVSGIAISNLLGNKLIYHLFKNAMEEKKIQNHICRLLINIHLSRMNEFYIIEKNLICLF